MTDELRDPLKELRHRFDANRSTETRLVEALDVMVASVERAVVEGHPITDPFIMGLVVDGLRFRIAGVQKNTRLM